MARLIRTEKEVEGRYEEVWIVVEEDELQQWPAGPLNVVGRPAERKTGAARARGETLFTGDLRLAGMMQAAILRSPHASAKVTRIDLSAALAAPGVRAAIGPGDHDALTHEPRYHGAPIAAVAADTEGRARAALALIEVEYALEEPLLDPDEAVARGELTTDVREQRRGDSERGLAEADTVVEGE
ncbi:MAG: hypothetical protein QOE29_2112, partial [Gaiellaceae bacterium]|nr:hypothetical protein [Gaiellaceae bacterium]